MWLLVQKFEATSYVQDIKVNQHRFLNKGAQIEVFDEVVSTASLHTLANYHRNWSGKVEIVKILKCIFNILNVDINHITILDI